MKKLNLFTSLLRSIRGDIDTIEVMERADAIEVVGKYYDKPVLYTISIKDIPYINPEDRGYWKTVKAKTPVSKKHGKEREQRYKEKWVLSESEEKFIRISYCKIHLDARQMSKVSGIPQEAIFQYIRHEKLKPEYAYGVVRAARNKIYTDIDEMYKAEDERNNELAEVKEARRKHWEEQQKKRVAAAKEKAREKEQKAIEKEKRRQAWKKKMEEEQKLEEQKEETHTHTFAVVGASYKTRNNTLDVDLVCSGCGVAKTAIVDGKYRSLVTKQASNHEIFNTPVISMTDF